MSKQQSTPISVILQLYQRPNQAPLVLEKLDEIAIKTQIQFLDPDKCNSPNHRNDIIRQFNNEDLRRNAFKRIRFKSMLSAYHKHWHQIRAPHFKMIENWNERDFALNVIVHFIKHSDDGKAATQDKELKRLHTTWRFLDYLTQFFDKGGFNGKEFIQKHANKHDNADKQKASGFGLTIVKEVCKQFGEKTGQYTKVKKQLSSWAKKNVDRYQKEATFSLDDIKENVVNEGGNVGGGNQGGNQVQNVVNEGGNKQVNEGGNKNNAGGPIPKGKGEKWFWFCDEGGIKWVPYQEEHQKIIEDAWCSNKQNVIVMTRFKIDFHRETPGIASGQQYNYQIHNSWRRGVIRGAPDGKNMINDIPCDAQPKY